MTAVAFGSAKGSPGATTTVLALAARWPAHREPIVVEADPAGGDLVARLAPLDGHPRALRDTPSTVQLAAACRDGLHATDLLANLQWLPGPGEVRALVAPASPFAASTALASLVAAGLGELLAGLDGVDPLVDVGRVDLASPAVPLLRALGSVVLVVRPTVTSVLHTRDLASGLTASGVACGLVIVGDRPYPPPEVASAVGATLLAVLPDDPPGARALAGEPAGRRTAGRSPLMRVSGDLAAHLAPTAPRPDPVGSWPVVPFPAPPAPPRPVSPPPAAVAAPGVAP